MKLQCAKLLDWFDQICRHRLIPICVAMWEIPRWKTEWRGGGLALIFNSEGKRMTYNRSWLPLNWRKLVECALSRHPGFGRMSCFLLILLNISPLLYCQYEIYLQSQASRRPVDNFYVIKSGMGTCTRCLSTFRRLFAYRDGIFRRIIYFRAKFRSWVDAFFLVRNWWTCSVFKPVVSEVREFGYFRRCKPTRGSSFSPHFGRAVQVLLTSQRKRFTTRTQ